MRRQLALLADFETRVAALADLENFSFEVIGQEIKSLVADDLATEPDGSALYKAARLAVGVGKTGEGDEIYYPDLLPRGQLDDGRIVGDAAAYDGVEGSLGVGDIWLAVKHTYKRAGELALLLDGLGFGQVPVE